MSASGRAARAGERIGVALPPDHEPACAEEDALLQTLAQQRTEARLEHPACRPVEGGGFVKRPSGMNSPARMRGR